MENLTEYAIFVMNAYLNNCEIEKKHRYYNIDKWKSGRKIQWDWLGFIYRIKLPEGWEYVYEDGEIAFRKPREGEDYLSKIGKPNCAKWNKDVKRPIIKRKGEEIDPDSFSPNSYGSVREGE